MKEEDIAKSFLVIEVLFKAYDLLSWDDSGVIDVACSKQCLQFFGIFFFFLLGVFLLFSLHHLHFDFCDFINLLLFNICQLRIMVI
jgi:hypothetical protein